MADCEQFGGFQLLRKKAPQFSLFSKFHSDAKTSKNPAIYSFRTLTFHLQARKFSQKQKQQRAQQIKKNTWRRASSLKITLCARNTQPTTIFRARK